MELTQLIAVLLPIIAQATPALVKDVVDLIHGNPQQDGEDDAAYIARVGALIDANVAKVEAGDKDVQA